MTKRTTLALLLSGLTLVGCVHLNSLSQTQIPSKRTTPIKANASKLIILGFNFDNDYVATVPTKLAAQCEGGEVRGILTKDEYVNYFFHIVAQRRVAATGYCVKGN